MKPIRIVFAGLLTVGAVTADGYAQERHITPSQEANVKKVDPDETFLVGSVGGYQPWIDFDHDCGLLSRRAGDVKKGERTYLVEGIADLSVRINRYPNIMKVLDKWTPEASAHLDEMKKIYIQATAIANGPQSALAKLRDAQPIMLRAEKISERLAAIAGVNYLGGCGAGPEDSEVVDFAIDPKPKEAVYILTMEFDSCKRVLTDPYDTDKCEAWQPIQSSGNELSGKYRYRVTWGDGTVSEHPFSALGTARKTIKITE
jgi:hypothetical protein